MPAKGKIITNQQTGDTYEFLETSKDTNGKCVVMRSTIRSKGQLVPRHFHALQDETFEVISGQLTVWLDGKTTTVSAGDKVMLPKNKPHNPTMMATLKLPIFIP